MKIIILVLFFLSFTTVFAVDLEPTKYLYHETLNLSETNPIVQFYLVEYSSHMPCPHNGPGILAGCSYYSLLEGTETFVYIVPEFYLDEFGMTVLAHEILHIECKCDWHMTQESKDLVHKYGKYPYRFIMQNAKSFQAYEQLN